MNKTTLFLLGLIFFLAAFLRLWQLDKLPIELFGDEIDVGLQAYSILKTGRDYNSNPFPVMFQSFSEYRLPANLYFTVPFVGLFGLNEWGVRLPFVIYGILSLLGTFLLAKELFDVRVALITTALMSISPWHLQFSRQANDAGGVLALTILAVWAYLVGLKHFKFLFLSVILFALAVYSYAIATVFIPLLVLSLIVLYWNKLKRYGLKKLSLVIAVGVLIILPQFWVTINGIASERFSAITVFNDRTVLEEVIRRKAIHHSVFTPIFENKIVALTLEILRNYLRSFSTEFLFIMGDPNLRQSVGSLGELYWFDIFTIILGLAILAVKFVKDSLKGSPGYSLVLTWLIISPIPAALTVGGGMHASRLIMMLPPLLILSAMGVNKLLESRIKAVKLFSIALLVLLVFNVSQYFYRYWIEWPIDSWRFWNYGFKETITYVKSIDPNFSRIYINNTYEPVLPRFLFWTAFDPALFQEQFKGDQSQINFVPGLFDGFKVGDKYYFGIIHKPIENLLKSGVLLVASARDDITNPDTLKNPKLKLLKTVYSPSDQPIFYIITSNED